MWLDFCKERGESKELNGISQDIWDSVYDLNKDTGGDLTNFEDDGLWPPIFDSFVEYYNQ